jgi:nucleoside-diphosphate-sugar epimerase
MKVLITGGNGLIGSHLAEALLQTGHKVILQDLGFGKNTRQIDCLKLGGDIRDSHIFDKINFNPDVIFHAAAVSRVAWGEADPKKCFDVNVIGGINIILWTLSKEPKPHFIFASSREVYGEPSSLPVTESHPKNPISAYGTSKLAAEQLVSHYGKVSDLKYTITRFSNVYGATRDLPERVIPRFVNNAFRGEPLVVNGGSQILDFTSVHDTIAGLVSLVSHLENRDPSVQNTDFHFTTGVGCSISDLADMIKTLTSARSKIQKVEAKNYDVHKFIGDFTKAKKILGYDPKVRLEDGLKRYIKEVSAEQGCD